MSKETKLSVTTKYTVPSFQEDYQSYYATVIHDTFVDGTTQIGIGNARKTRWDAYNTVDEAKMALAKEVRRDLEAKLAELKAETDRAQATLNKLTLFGLDSLVNHAVEYWVRPGTKPEPPKPEPKQGPVVKIKIQKRHSKFPYGSISGVFTKDHEGMQFMAVRNCINYYRLTMLATETYIHIYDCVEVQ